MLSFLSFYCLYAFALPHVQCCFPRSCDFTESYNETSMEELGHMDLHCSQCSGRDECQQPTTVKCTGSSANATTLNVLNLFGQKHADASKATADFQCVSIQTKTGNVTDEVRGCYYTQSQKSSSEQSAGKPPDIVRCYVCAKDICNAVTQDQAALTMTEAMQTSSNRDTPFTQILSKEQCMNAAMKYPKKMTTLSTFRNSHEIVNKVHTDNMFWSNKISTLYEYRTATPYTVSQIGVPLSFVFH